ncbi:Regulator of sigma-W protease RasP [bioreactor metagenome]|uniref:Regulator of sigma-W protease RasP n=1 Tax=bioreactor metagenome TaxID=1076179 RepID=A0A645EHF1_9ZZZZ
MVALSVADLIRGKVPVTDLSGPVGVAGAIGEAAKTSVIDLMNLLALISINLGVINLFPLPALDGGRLVFLVIEGITRKKVPTKYEGYVHYAGFVLLMVLMAFLVYNDIFRMVVK